MRRIHRRIQRWVYRLGFRPKYGTLFYSPSRDLAIAWKDFGREFEKAIINAQAEVDKAMKESES